MSEKVYSFGQGVPTYNGIPMIGAFQKDFSGSTYYVDGNCGIDDQRYGKSLKKPYKTLAYAFDVSHSDIARGSDRWARRNTVFIAGDTFTETLVAFPQKTDVIGIGSYDSNKQAGIIGNHAPVNAGIGTRFFNVWFKGPAVASPLITLTAACSGMEVEGCVFDAHASTTTAITSTASPYMKVRHSRFQGAFATAYISIAAGEAGGTVIRDNVMGDGAAVGILISNSATTSWRSVIKDNFIQTGTITIDDNSDLFYIVGNDLISAGAGATVGTMADAMQCDINPFRASGNRLACSNVCGIVVPPVDSTT
jgi:hypothetical protein